MHHGARFIALLTAELVAGFACEPVEPDPESTQQPIIGGTAMTRQQQIDMALASISNNCAAVLYKNDWAISSAHCFGNMRTSNEVSVASPEFTAGGFGMVADQVILLQSEDLALVHTAGRFVVRGSSSGFQREIAAARPPVSSLLTCMGRGPNAISPQGGFAGEPGWRFGRLRYLGDNGPMLRLAVTDGQTLSHGDSGGPCMISGLPNMPGTPLVAINSSVSVECFDPRTEATCRASVTRVKEASAASVAGMAARFTRLTSPGVRVESAVYGGGGCNSASVVGDVASQCDGRSSCLYFVDHRRVGDPSPNCRKPFTATFRCAGSEPRTISVPAEASGQLARLDCSGISVLRATYGMNRIVTGNLASSQVGNATWDVAGRCAGQPSCDYTVSVGRLGDPSPNFQKDFVVEFTCHGQFGTRVATVDREANGRQITLSCQ